MEILVYGIIQSASLLLMAFGFSLVYGICRLPNFAHGALFVLTGYVAWFLLDGLVSVVNGAALNVLGNLLFLVVLLLPALALRAGDRP